jgi:hypothetical protein
LSRPIRHDYEYDNDKRRGIHVDLPPLTRFQPLVLSFGSNSLRGFIFVKFLSEYQNITGVIAAACCKTTASSERDIKEGG